MSPRPLFAIQSLRLPQAEADLPQVLPSAALCHRFTLGQSPSAPAKAVWKARP
ncbi:hypothetical protein ACCC88_17075 [Sphingomonas sp. Sphisp140]|uniref:hypothetical protein n=1 Tax=Sphingomonas TaxID=13687 RepID=UPI0027800941|nr:hypothetical protein [Sphingomonas kyeonggiensis]MDQ0252102.1 hypothetical protein [Sphingomonas kyeonggiensis]